MNNKTAKQIVTGYRIKCVLVALLYAVALALLVLLMARNMFFGIVLVVLLGVSIKAPFDKLREKCLESVIYEDLDPEKFNEILALGVLKKSIRHKVLYLMAVGDHDEILRLIKESEPKTSHPVDKCNNLYREGYVYFERGEYDKLATIYKKYEKLKVDNPKFITILNNFSVFEKYDAFADDDFEYVVDVCNIDLKEINPKKQNHKLTRINVSFYRAVSLYKMGKLDEAKKGFEDIIEFAPKMYKAKLSKEFIQLIDNK
jgi:tetratricopeptide (TPR) repeat protein